MAIEIKEYVGHEFTSIKQKPTKVADIKEGYAETCISENSIMVDIEAIHSRITRNNTYYSPTCLKDSEKYWTYPYERPVIMHHNERDGQIIGRIKAARYTETDTRGETPALEFTANIGNEQGIKGIKDGTLSTVSIGVIAHDLRCSICGTNLAEEGMCEHEKGEVYDNELCYWIINKMEPKEVSYVIVPSDIYAHNIKVYDAVNKKKSEVKESMETNNPFAELLEATQAEITAQEGKQIDEEIKDKEVEVKDQTIESKEDSKEDSKEEPETKEESTEEEETKEEAKEETSTSEEDEKEKTEETEESEKKSVDEETKEEEAKEEEAKEEETSNKELEAAKATIKTLEKEIEDLKKDNKKLEAKVDTVTAAKESLETELVEFRTERRKELAENINKLREGLNLPLENINDLIENSEENLHITIKGLKEFSQVQTQRNAFGIQQVSSPISVSEEKDNTVKQNKKVTDVKESTQDSNKTLEDQYIKLMMNIF